MRPTAIIVDDETNLIDYLAEKLKRLWPDLEILGTAQNGRQAIALATDCQPDVVFLDISMPGLSGLQVAEALPNNSRVVFVTAFDEHAVAAFERAAVDYVLKPVSDSRLLQTIQRLQEKPGPTEEILDLLAELGNDKKLHWIRAGIGDTTELVSVDEVVYFKAEQKYTSVVTPNREYVVRRTIKDLEQDLDPNQFWRVHRGIIVKVDCIESARRDLRGRYTINLRGRPETIRTSQSYAHLFKQM